MPNIFNCILTFSKEIHGSYSWHPTKSQKAVRNDKITRTLIISRKSYWARMKRALTQAKFKLNNQKVQVSGLSGFILSALKSLKSSKISLCSSKTVFNAVGWLICYVDWSPLVHLLSTANLYILPLFTRFLSLVTTGQVRKQNTSSPPTQ